MFKKFRHQNSKHGVNHFIRIAFVGICLLFFEVSAYGQCAMCRAALQNSGDTAKAEAVNDGIVYLMVIPYILVGAIGLMIYISRKKKKGLGEVT